MLLLALEPTNDTPDDPFVGVSGHLVGLGGEVGNEDAPVPQVVVYLVAGRGREPGLRWGGPVVAPWPGEDRLALEALMHDQQVLGDLGQGVFGSVLCQCVEPYEGVVADLGVAPLPRAHRLFRGLDTPVLVVVATASEVKVRSVDQEFHEFVGVWHGVGPVDIGNGLLCHSRVVGVPRVLSHGFNLGGCRILPRTVP